MEGVVEHQSVGKIVNIFRCARKMKELFLACELAISLKLFLQEVLNCFDVMVCCSLNLFNPFSILDRKVAEDLVHECLLSGHALDRGRILRHYLLSE